MKLKITLLIISFVLVFAFILYSPSLSGPTIQEPTLLSEKKIVHSCPFVYSNPNPHIQQLLAEYELFIRRAIENNLAPGAAIAVIKDTSVVFLKGFGLRDATTTDSIDIHSVFRIGSVSKCLASTLTGVLVDENRLSWQDPVIRYLPLFKLKSEEHTQKLTLRHVLSHTTGLPYHAFTDRVDQGASFDTLVYHLRDLDLLGKPGQLYSYQNVGYSLIGQVIHAATGKTYEENLKENIFTPLHMQSASTSYAEIMSSSNMAKPHHFFRRWVPMAISNTYYSVSPAGGVNASVADMAQWLLSLTSDSPRILKNTTKDEIFRPVVRAISRNNYFWRWKPLRSAYYALGWRVLNFKDDTLVYHGGYVNGYRSEVAIHRKDNLAICVLVNSPGNLADISVPKFFELYSKYRKAIDQWEKLKAGTIANR